MRTKQLRVSSWCWVACVLLAAQRLAAFPTTEGLPGTGCPFQAHQRRLHKGGPVGSKDNADTDVITITSPAPVSPAPVDPLTTTLQPTLQPGADQATVNVTVNVTQTTNSTVPDPTATPADNTTTAIIPTQATYDPRQVDWASVVTACRLAGAWEKRFRNFWIRAAFHDGGAINPSACSADATYDACFSQNGLDASLLLNAAEGAREENAYDNFTALTAVMTIRIASVYNTSVADALAVCASAAVEDAANVPILSLKQLKVGRVDNSAAAPRLLPAAIIGTQGFMDWFRSRGYSIEEGVALLGSHALIDASACYKGNRTWCDPVEESCDDVRMFHMENFYYHEVCTPSLVVEPHDNVLDGFIEAPIVAMGDVEFASLVTSETCKWTSTHMRDFIQADLDLIRKGKKAEKKDVQLPLDAHWFSSGCEYSPPGVDKKLACPRFMTAYPYTINDGFLGLACQGNIQDPNNATNKAVQAAMRTMLDSKTWKDTFVRAFLKLLNGPAKGPGAKVPTSFVTADYESVQGTMLTSNIAWMDIDGTECPSGLGADGKCSTAATKFEDFGIGIALPTANRDTTPIGALPLELTANRLATTVLSGMAISVIIRRLDNALPISLAEVEVYDINGDKIAIAGNMVFSPAGAAPEVVDGDPSTVLTTPASVFAPSVTVRITTQVQVSRIVVTHGPGAQNLVGTVVEYQSTTGTLTQLLATSSLTYTVFIATNGLHIVDGLAPAGPTIADNVLTFIVASFSATPFSIGPVEVYSGQFQVTLTPGAVRVSGTTTDGDPTKSITSSPITAGSGQMSWIRLSVTLPPLTRADRLILKAHSGLEGARLYYGEPGAALSSLVTAAAAAEPTMTIFFGATLITVPGTSALITGDTLLELAIYNPFGVLDLATSALTFYDTVNKVITLPASAIVVTPSLIKVKLDRLGVGRLVIRKVPMDSLIGTVIQLSSTRGTFYQQLSAQVATSVACTVWLSLKGISAVPNLSSTPQPEDTTVSMFLSRKDGKPLTVSELAFFDERGLLMDLPAGALLAGDGQSTDNVIDADLTTTATIDGNPAWLLVKLPSAPTSFALVGSAGGDVAGATLSLQDPAEGVGTVLLGTLDKAANNFTVYVGVNTLTPVPGVSYVFASGSQSSLFNPSRVAFPAVPPSPYLKDRSVCSAADQYFVGGFPSSPHVFAPFTVPFKNPPAATSSGRSCRTDGHCLTAFDITVKHTTANIGCAKDTIFISYNGSVPGPTLYTPVGEEVLIRYNNQLDGGRYASEDEWPCVAQNKRKGIPLSIHNHGQASLAPHDGWAENEICGGETKDYLYPNNRPATGWCHDHALDVTAPNAYHGAAMFYVIGGKKGHGPNCGEPWNLDNIPEYFLMLNDKLVDSECQLVMDRMKYHINNFYGDINLVSGLPWPVLTVQPHFVRFRMLTAGPTRPFKIHIVDNMGVNVGSGASQLGSGVRCKVIAGDGGFFQRPVDLPQDGIFVAVAERYELVCDFRDLAGQTLFLWNARDNVRAKDVPYFCHSHLLMKIEVLAGCHTKCTGAALKLVKNEMVCGGMCYRGNCTKGADKQLACCPAGQFCQRQDASYWYCRTGGKAATCPHAGTPEKMATGEVRCGGRCFQDPSCSAKAEQRACCPAGQFCWAKTNNNWVCRQNPIIGAAGKDPGLSMKACSSHPAPVYPTLKTGKIFQTQMDKVLSQADYEAAVQMANDGRSHRVMKFGRRNGEWVINGDTWHTFKIAAHDVGVNSWEVWELSSGGGWFHPVHIHLVDFWVIRRKGPVDHVEPYEYFAPKDVVALHPSETVWIVARWGPHRGDYMFHCHNLIHEDRAMMRAFRTSDAAGKNMGTASGPVNFRLLMNPSTGIVYDNYNTKDPMSFGATLNPPKLDSAYLQKQVDNSMYRIFFPAPDDDAVLLDSIKNPWKVDRYTNDATCPALVV